MPVTNTVSLWVGGMLIANPGRKKEAEREEVLKTCLGRADPGRRRGGNGFWTDLALFRERRGGMERWLRG